MTTEPPGTAPAANVPAAAAKEWVEAESRAAVADPVRWEFRLTADRRRILVAVDRAARADAG
jgi:hypothetical protein